jgi:hypothetical protein
MLNKKEKAKLNDIEDRIQKALNLITTQKLRNDALMLKNDLLEAQVQELRSRLKSQNA